jgi:type IVB pilus formation R64 PilN family outer membrane protein
VGCQSPPLYNQTQNNIADDTQRVKDALAKSDETGKPTPPLVVNQGLYIDKTPISLARDPSWLRSRIILQGDLLPFSYYSRTIASGNDHILIHYGEGIKPDIKLAMNYTGTVKGALDLLATKTGYTYSVSGRNIYWQAYISKTFDIAFMPGTTDYELGGNTSDSAASGGSSTGSSSGGVSSGGQTSTLKGSLSVWKDLEDTIKTLLSLDGKVVVSQATTSVTVRDKPANVALVGKYINNLNSSLTKQVLVKVQVLSIQLSSAFSYGINWTVVENAFSHSKFVLNGNYGTPISLQTLTGSGTTILPFGGVQSSAITPPTATSPSGVTALINALKQQGAVAVVSEPRVVCLNNQVSVIRIVNNQAYAQSVATTAIPGSSTTASSAFVQTSITPGTIITGLILYVLPKIKDDHVALQVNATLSTLLGISKFSSGEGASQASIQTPTTSNTQINQRSVIGSGDTLILSGFRQTSNQSGAQQLLDSQTLGGKAAIQQNEETIVLITPIILNGFA